LRPAVATPKSQSWPQSYCDIAYESFFLPLTPMTPNFQIIEIFLTFLTKFSCPFDNFLNADHMQPSIEPTESRPSLRQGFIKTIMEKATAILLILMAFGPGKDEAVSRNSKTLLPEGVTEMQCPEPINRSVGKSRVEPCYAAARQLPVTEKKEAPEDLAGPAPENPSDS
jgi:hypothetical protein